MRTEKHLINSGFPEMRYKKALDLPYHSAKVDSPAHCTLTACFNPPLLTGDQEVENTKHREMGLIQEKRKG